MNKDVFNHEGIIPRSEVGIITVKNVIIVSIPSNPNDSMISEMQENILNLMNKKALKAVILDISLVDIVDSFFARTIKETTQMINLMSGGFAVIAGMQPSVAITITELGLNIGDLKTALTVDSAIDYISQQE